MLPGNGRWPAAHEWGKLAFNHLDAWGPALIISLLALLVHEAVDRSTLLLAGAIGLGYWLAFAVNDYYDAPHDAAEPAKARRNFFVGRPVSRRRMRFLVWLCGGLVFLPFLQFGGRGALVAAVSALIIWGYSAPPLRFKSRPGLDLLVHALFVETFPYLVCLLLLGAAWGALDWVLLAILFLASLTAQLEQQIRDYVVDARTDRNFTTTVGRETAVHLLHAASILLIVVSGLNVLNGTIPPFIAAFGLIAAPAIGHRFTRGRRRPRSERLVFFSTLTGLVYMGVVVAYRLIL